MSFAECFIFAAVAHDLRQIVFAVGHFDVDDGAFVVADGNVDGVDEPAIGRDVEAAVAVEHLFVEFRVDFDGVGLDEVAAGFVVTFALDSLDFAEKLSEEIAESGVVVDFDVGLAVFADQFDNIVGLTFLESPFGDELAVSHVGFLDILARLDAHELGHEAVEHIFVVFGLVGVGVVEQSELDEFRVAEIVEGEEVGAGFLKGRTVSLEGVGVDSGEQASRAVAQTFVEVGVEVVGDEEVFVEKVGGRFVDDEFLVESVAVAGFVVGAGDVFESH